MKTGMTRIAGQRNRRLECDACELALPQSKNDGPTGDRPWDQPPRARMLRLNR
jgi:hypothetical protein